ncbi:metal-dependent hydrolase [Salmonella enterica subsp. enterica]|nr:metal-dependent hydrolase [Salmonella enterica subsp. enterica]
MWHRLRQRVGHRGFTHSFTFAFVLLLCVLAGRRWFRAGAGALLAVFNRFICCRTACWIRSPRVVKGVGWLWPWSDERFAPRRVR